MNWHLFAFIAPALWAICNYLDKYVLTRYFKDENSTGVLLIVSGFAAAVSALIILIAGVNVTDPSIWFRLIMLGNGMLFVAAFYPYFYALREEDASVVVPVYQTIPVFGYILGLIFLNEHLNPLQIFGGLIIIIGAIGLSINFRGKIKIKSRPLLLMLFSAFLLAVGNLIFKKVALQESYWVTNFWEYLGSGLFGLILFTWNTSYRRGFIYLITKKQVVFALSGIQEAFNVAGNLMSTFAILLAPMALVSVVVNGLQPFYIFIFGIILTLLLPKYFKEKIEKQDLIQKFICIMIIFGGTVLLAVS